jgi:dolichol-phosphate mannosyltransferase
MAENLVIIPTYNEKENIEKMIHKVFSLEVDFDLLVVDDNSPDGTAKIVKTLQAEYPQRLHILERKGKLGLGTAYIAGFKWAIEKGYERMFEMDADFQHNPNDLLALYKASVDGADVVIGSRYISGVNVVNWPMKRVLMSYYASYYVRKVTGMPVRDATAGFKCYSRKVLEAINFYEVNMKGYGFQIEMKFTAWKLGFTIKEVPIIFMPREGGNSKMSGGIFNEAFWGVIGLKWKSIFHNFKKLHQHSA